MDYNVVGFVGLVMFGLGVFVIIWAMAADLDDPFALGMGGAALIFAGILTMVVAGAMQSYALAEDCQEMGGIYLRKERACLTKEFFRGRGE